MQNTLEAIQQPPPIYDRYYLDEVYDDTLVIGSRTPTQSGSVTPTLQMSSRSSSYGNLAALNTDAAAQEPLSDELQRRLAEFSVQQHGGSHLRDVETVEEASRNSSVVDAAGLPVYTPAGTSPDEEPPSYDAATAPPSPS